LPLLDDAHRHRLRRGASHLPARRSRQNAHLISWRALTWVMAETAMPRRGARWPLMRQYSKKSLANQNRFN